MKSTDSTESVEMTLQTLLKILDHSSDEIFVLDGEKADSLRQQGM